jgi:electron transfer flavoprotein alpha/beta subunit
VTRQELEHLIRAAASVADEDDLVVVGSQAIDGDFREAASGNPGVGDL